jgi:3-phenylpropionate/trans-cinnamate dioxygenase ferredoxin reductase subunit
MQDTIVVIGGGHAGAQVVDSLRREHFAGRLVLVCGEPVLPYQRPPLSKKFLAGELDEARLPIRPASFYESIHCELVLGNSVTAIDTAARTLALADGGQLGYDRLVLAVGGHAPPPVPGAEARCACCARWRTLRDPRRLRRRAGRDRRRGVYRPRGAASSARSASTSRSSR